MENIIKPKVLITVPELSRPGGVSGLYNILQLNKEENVSYFEIHGFAASNKVFRFFDLIFIYITFILKLPHYNIVHSNPSLSPKSYYRDGFFILLSLLFRKKVVVSWHGWDDKFAQQIFKNKILKKIFRLSYQKGDYHIVLGLVFKKKLEALGVVSKILIESNAASDTFLNGEIAKEISRDKVTNILFLSRIEKYKGIYIAIDAVSRLPKSTPVTLIVAGDGAELPKVREYVINNHIECVRFVGYVEGEKKHEVLKSGDLLLFPTYSEGMPIVILEAMLYGMPVITRPVGGIPDWVTNNENGLLIESLDSEEFAEAIKKLLLNSDLYNQINKNNIVKAAKYFTPKAVNERILGYYSMVLNIK